ncbi:MAG: EAL domain-containing protein [Alphaproteobacteria bacterium]|nr:EAL domain-containing protein [Alphaproteobacteria bacterium]
MFTKTETFINEVFFLYQQQKNFNVFEIFLSNINKEERTEERIKFLMKYMATELQPNGRIFRMDNDNLFIIMPSKIPDNKIEVLKTRVCMTFPNDPACEDKESLSKKFSIPKDYKLMELHARRTAENKLESKPEEKKEDDGRIRFAKVPLANDNKKELTPESLARITHALSNTDFTNMVRGQFVCAVMEGVIPSKLFKEVYVSIQDLGEAVLPGVSLTKAPWLFADMSETLDKRVLQTVARHIDGAFYQDFSLNLNVNSLLSEDFEHFNETISTQNKPTVIFEIRPSDVYSNLEKFEKARDYVHKLGYRLCLDGVNLDNLEYMDPNRLGVDYVKITWQDDFPQRLKENHELVDNIKRIGTNRTILCRVDDLIALNVAWDNNITMLQGRLIQEMLLRKQKYSRLS